MNGLRTVASGSELSDAGHSAPDIAILKAALTSHAYVEIRDERDNYKSFENIYNVSSVRQDNFQNTDKTVDNYNSKQYKNEDDKKLEAAFELIKVCTLNSPTFIMVKNEAIAI